MSTRSSSLTVLLLAFLMPPLSYGEEVQVPLDTLGRIFQITADMERRLQLFPDYPQFQEARLFQVADSAYVLEILYQSDHNMLKAQFPKPLSDVIRFRQIVSQRVGIAAPQAVLNQEGRSRLVVGTFLLSLGFYGFALPTVTHTVDAGAASLYMLTGAAGYLIPLMVTSNVDVTRGAANLGIWGGTRGLSTGLSTIHLFKGERARYDDEFGWMTLESIGGIVAGYTVAERHGWSDGTVAGISLGGDLGLLGGSAISRVAIDPDDWYEDGPVRTSAAIHLASTAGGLALGKWLADRGNYSRGDAYVVRGTSFVCGYAGIAVGDIAGGDEPPDQLVAATALAGLGIGTVLGHHFVSDKEFSAGDGVLFELGGVAGGLAGLGLAYAVDNEGSDSRLYVGLSAAGALGGLLIGRNVLSGTSVSNNSMHSWNLQLNPTGLLSFRNRGNAKTGAPPVPIGRLEYRF